MARPMILVPKNPVLVDKRIEIRITNLRPFQKVTLRAELRSEKNEIFESFGHYVAGFSGEVNLNKDASFGGSYTGIDGMGLFWSMTPAPGQRRGLRYTAKTVEKPMEFRLGLFDDHVTSLEGTGKRGLQSLATETVLRTYLSSDVERVEISVGRIRGTLFIPKKEGRFPGVIDLFGSHGNLLEYRAALMASHGFTTFALAYFEYKDLPKLSEKILELEYFLEAAHWLSQHNRVAPGGIGFVGVSLGGIIALLAASIDPVVNAVVAISTPNFVDGVGSYRNELIGFDTTSYAAGIIIKDDVIFSRDYIDLDLEVVKKNEIKVENITGPIMLLTGEGDTSINSVEMARRMKERAHKNDAADVVHLSYPKTGHLIEPPFMPMCSMSFHKTFNHFWAWGGDIVEHSAAQEHAWRNVLCFLRKNIVKEIPKSNL